MTRMPSPAAPRRRARALLSVTAAAVLALTACGPKDEPAESRPSPSSSDAQTLPPMDMAPFTMDVPMHDLGMLPGATLRAISGEDPDYDGAWFSVPHAASWTRAMEDAVQARVDAFTRDATDEDVRLDVQPLLAVVGTSIAATRIVSTQKREDDDVESSQVIWYDAQDRRVLEAQDLFGESGWSALRRELSSRLQEDPDVNEDRLDAAVRDPEAAENRRVWDGIVLLEDGSLLLEVDQGSLAPEDAGVLTARVSPETLAPWLSEAGRRAQEAAQSPAALELGGGSSPSAPAAPPRPSATTPGASQAPETSPGPDASPAPSTGGAPSSSARPGTPTSAPSESSAQPSRPESPSPRPSESSADPSRSESPSPRPSPSGSESPSPSPSESPSPSPSESPDPSESPSPSPTTSPSQSPTPTPSPSESPEPSGSPDPSESPEPSESPAPSESPTASASPTSEAPEPSPTASATGAVESPVPSPSGSGEASSSSTEHTAAAVLG